MDFFNFFLIYVILTVMFAIVGNINFMNELTIFEGFFQSFLTVIDASLGNYEFEVFQSLANENMVLFGEIYLITLVLIFNILLLNFIIAILSNTYNIFDNRSNGLYLSKILSTRDELNYDHSYGAFLSSIPPINIIQLPCIPLALIFRYGDNRLKETNRLLMQTQYSIFMLVFYSLFIIVSICLIPFAWVFGIIDKVKSQTSSTPLKEKILNFGLFIPLGIPILFLDTLCDFYYFWKNNFRRDLQKIII